MAKKTNKGTAAATTANDNVEIVRPSVLSYRGSVVPTDATFKADVNGVLVPVPVTVKTVLGTQSQYVNGDKAQSAWGNPQRIEAAALPHGSSTLVVEWHAIVIGAALKPDACNETSWRIALQSFAMDFSAREGFNELGRRYATNIANARWTWVNRLFASMCSVQVMDTDTRETMTFNAFEVPLDSFDLSGNPHAKDIEKLGLKIGAALATGCPLRLYVRGDLHMIPGSKVYPSQEFVDKDPDKTSKSVGKLLHSVQVGDVRCASFHEQKVGNALRTIDTWHGGSRADDMEQVPAEVPLAVNPYGQSSKDYVLTRPRVAKNDLYSLMEKSFPNLSSLSEEEAYFVAACLVRGGVYGMKDKEDPKKDPKKKGSDTPTPDAV